MKKFILIANGRAPSKRVFPFLKKNGYSDIICADGGANTAMKLGLTPDIIIGDLDSASPQTLDFFSDKCKIIRLKRQNDTDVEKCLKYAIAHDYTHCVMLGVIGDRLDHSFCNLGIAIKFSDDIDIKIIDDKSILSVHQGKTILNTSPDETISLYGFNKATKIKSRGLKYNLNNISLPFGFKESTSNKAVSGTVKLEISGGKIFVIRDFDTVKQNGLF